MADARDICTVEQYTSLRLPLVSVLTAFDVETRLGDAKAVFAIMLQHIDISLRYLISIYHYDIYHIDISLRCILRQGWGLHVLNLLA